MNIEKSEEPETIDDVKIRKFSFFLNEIADNKIITSSQFLAFHYFL